MDVSDIFYFFCSGEGNWGSKAQGGGGGGIFYGKSQEGGSPGGGGGGRGARGREGVCGEFEGVGVSETLPTQGVPEGNVRPHCLGGGGGCERRALKSEPEKITSTVLKGGNFTKIWHQYW